MDIKAYTDEGLQELRVEILNEQERRQRLADIPFQIADLKTRFLADGGDPAELET